LAGDATTRGEVLGSVRSVDVRSGPQALTDTTPHLPGVLHTLEPTLNHYGYLAVAGLVLLEDFGVPVPGETVLILGAVYAGTGRLNIFLVGLLGFLAAIVGDNIGFGIGHFGGRALVDRFGRYVLLTPARYDKAADFFTRHGGKVIVIARFVEGLRQANGIVAGTIGMHWARFLMFNAIGAALWVATWTSIGYFSGSHIDSIYSTATKYDKYLGIAVGVIIVAYIARRFLRARARRAARETEAQEAAAARPGGVYARDMDLGTPVSYEVLAVGTPVYADGGEEIGKVSHVLAAEDEDVFDGIVIGEHRFGHDHRFADADDIAAIYERGVVLKLDLAAAEDLPAPSANPAVMREDPAESRGDELHAKLMRAWDRISGNY
jgi:membrane protein DedA with SNARE-associated domain